jgi:RNA polymerase sigma-70 factor (ECF subfamily)
MRSLTITTEPTVSKPGAAPPPATMPASDRLLVERLRAGDEAAYEALVRQHGGAMLAVARRIMRHEDDARDVVQDAFAAAFRSLEQFRIDARLSTWLHRIVVNAALMKLRAAGRRPEVLAGDDGPEFLPDGHHAAPIASVPALPDEAVERARVVAAVRAAVETLPPSFRTVVILRDLEELSTEETARALGITPTAVKVRLHRARKALVARLQRLAPTV